MTIRDDKPPPRASAPKEEEVVVIAEPAADPYTTGSNINVPYAEATTVGDMEDQLQQQQKPQPRIAYSTGAAPQPVVAIPTNAPVVQVAEVGPRRRNNQGCCSQHSCCCITSIIFVVLLICCVLPIAIFVAIVGSVASSIPDDDGWYNNPDDIFGDDSLNQSLNGYLNENYGN